MRKFLLGGLLAAAVAPLAGCTNSGSPAPGYTISEEKTPVTVKLTRGGKPYTPGANQSATLALFGVGGIRYDLRAKGDGVFESPADAPIPHGEYTATLFVTGGRAPQTFGVARKLAVGPGNTQHTIEVKTS